ncbi:MAG: hypothetical protein JO225_04930, partial [Candidatus Eremiobacteraeota bacterium]|nr:hypothetical protein [Candidatus Eremiobacteraeota bacterium]
SVLVLEGIPESQRGPGGFDYAKVLEVHDGPTVMAPVSSLSCKMEVA